MPYEIVKKFEKTIAEYAGAKYGIAVSSCTNAIFLCCKRIGIEGKTITIPRYTYPGVACSILHAGGKLAFHDKPWAGAYTLEGTPIVDSALRFYRGMYRYFEDKLLCLSFHIKKHLPIGRGGMILTNDINHRLWLEQARFDGRHQVPLVCDKIMMVGWNMYMTPEQAAHGLHLFNLIKNRDYDVSKDMKPEDQGYPDLSKIEAYQ